MTDVVGTETARRGGRAEETAAEASFLIGPVNETQRDVRGARRTLPPQHLQAGDDAETAVEPASIRNGIEMAADQQRSRQFARHNHPVVARGIGPIGVVASELPDAARHLLHDANLTATGDSPD